MTMGTASTMTAIAESLGLTLPGASSIPAADSNHIRMATACGRRIVQMVNEKGPAPPVRRVRASVQPRDRHLREARGCLVDSTGGILQTPPPESGVQGELLQAPG